MILIPIVASQVRIPIIAAGGFTGGNNLVATLALGADAISLGTRFCTTKESQAHEYAKQSGVRATEEDTIISDRFDGVNCRVLKTKVAESLSKRSSYNRSGDQYLAHETGAYPRRVKNRNS